MKMVISEASHFIQFLSLLPAGSFLTSMIIGRDGGAGYEPEYDIDRGVAEYIEWLRYNPL